MTIQSKVIHDEPVLKSGYVMVPDYGGNGGLERQMVRLLDKGEMRFEPPCVIRGIHFAADSPLPHPSPIVVQNWFQYGVTPATIATHAGSVAGSRALTEPDTIVFKDCLFQSSQRWAETANGLISHVWVENHNPDGRIPKPFKVRFEDCVFNIRTMVLFDGHPSEPGLNRQVDVEFLRCNISVNLHGEGMEPNDPHTAIHKSSRGILTVKECVVSMFRNGALRDVSLNCFSVSDGILKQRLDIDIDDGLTYDSATTFYNWADISDTRCTMSPERLHNRNSVLGCTGPAKLSCTLTDLVHRCNGIVHYSEEYGGRNEPSVNGSEGYTHGSHVGSTQARRWMEYYP